MRGGRERREFCAMAIEISSKMIGVAGRARWSAVCLCVGATASRLCVRVRATCECLFACVGGW